MNFINTDIALEKVASEKKVEYIGSAPFPNMVFENFLDPGILAKVLEEFPDLSKEKAVIKFDNHNEKKLGAQGEQLFGEYTRQLMHFLNSEPILKFLQELTGIQETLLPDPYFIGGGYHEIKQGGLLKVHADFNKHRLTGLDRRINMLIYLNENWEESFGGHFELWDKDLNCAVRKILPTFNTVAIFSTTDFSYHGHPDPLTCPPDRSRKSLALYYYTNGRPITEVNPEITENTTAFVGRKNIEDDVKRIKRPFKSILLDFIPPICMKILRR